jgi:putative MATE family efflux protein
VVSDTTAPARAVLRLALPALAVLVAEPLYLLVDTAVVGHLGVVPLAGLAVAGVVFGQVPAQLIFLSYGTTARTARLHGAGQRAAAVVEGVQATWLALMLGGVVLAAGQLAAAPLTRALAGAGAVADAAAGWLRVALLGAPFVLVTLAGNGWMRGVQDTVRPLRYVLAGNGLSAALCPVLVYGVGPVPRLGLTGSAAANVCAQLVSAALFARALHRERVPLAPRWRVLRRQLGLGRDLLVRSMALQVCAISAASVAARTSAAAVAAHQVVLQLWFFLALVLDSLAIAAQSLVGAALGAGDAPAARAVAARVSRYGLGLGALLGVLFAAAEPVLPRAFTGDAAVLAQIPYAWWIFAAMQPAAGVVFALDGVLLGAGDAAFLRTATVVAAVFGFLPLIWASMIFGWGLLGIWSGLAAFIVVRLVFGVLRARGDRWAVPGAVRA